MAWAVGNEYEAGQSRINDDVVRPSERERGCYFGFVSKKLLVDISTCTKYLLTLKVWKIVMLIADYVKSALVCAVILLSPFYVFALIDTVAMSVSDNPTNPQVTEDSEDKENANVGPSNTAYRADGEKERKAGERWRKAYRAVRKGSDDGDVFTPVRFNGMETGINHIFTSSVTRNSSQHS